ncbi:hypothetical protein CPBF426_20490 [Xanthomonas arboricola pv. juglandis]|nr:hypothetical protein CPBF426_20490 [Xanthomonas arboricola pv. juglandis]
MMPGSDRGPIVIHGFHDDGDGFTGLSRSIDPVCAMPLP